MGFIIENPITGEYVEMNTQTSEYRITKDKSKSHRFKKQKSAHNFLACDTQKILKQEGWKVTVEAFKPPEDTHKIPVAKNIEESLDDMERLKKFHHFEANADLSKSFEVPNINIVSTIIEFERFLRNMKKYADVLSKQYTYIEYCKLDYEHKIEKVGKKLDIIQRAELLTNYSTCCEERRRIKDDILILERLLNASILDLIDGKLDEYFEKLNNRYYVPRVAPELFEKDENVQVKPKFKYDSVERDSTVDDLKHFNKLCEQELLSTRHNFKTFPECGETDLLSQIGNFELLPDCGE